MRDLLTPHTNPRDIIRRRVAAGLLAGAVLAGSGCGESPPTAMSDGRAARWHETIAGIRTADRPQALAALARLSGYVERDTKAGQLTPADAAALRAGIAQARRHLPRAVAAPTTALAVGTVTPPPPTAASRPHGAVSTTPPRPPAAPPASKKNEAKAHKDAAKAQKQSREAQNTKSKPQKRKAKGAKR